jgi:fructosamine-3-kinase
MSSIDTLAAEALRLAGDTTPLRGQTAVGGGSISRAIRLRTDRGEYLLKAGGRGLPGFFAAEARGLELLRGTGAVRVPDVLAYHDPEPTTDHHPEGTRPTTTSDRDKETRRQGDKETVMNNLPFSPSPLLRVSQSSVVDTGFILLEWLAAPPQADRSRAAMVLGHQLAALHRTTAPAYGLDHDNYIGATPQPNGWMQSWAAFFRERRLGFQAGLARRNGLLTAERERRLERLLARLDRWIDDRSARPALLHGDLWSGNFIVGPGGAPALIDPAACYGDREADLAFTALFGGFPQSFYRAYEEAWPLPAGWQERRDLYNLYHLLNHLNLFGEGYGGQVDQVLRRYVG